jgi:bifunctional enzyme CysN/CysC
MLEIEQKSHSGLIWITGYSGAGKTTLARTVSEKLRVAGIPIVLLDGDDLRSIFGERFGHTLDDRRQLAYVYSRLCHKISECGVTVVIATIAMFESVRIENRASNDTYFEVYLNVPFAVREERDPKGLYKAAAVKLTNADGFLAGLEEPVNPDLVIDNYGEVSPELAASLIVEKFHEFRSREGVSQKAGFEGSAIEDVNRSRSLYWDSYYSKRKAPINPSSFALFCNENYFESHCHVLEFGCGNGRDSFYFAKTHRVTAVDDSNVVVDSNRIRALQEGVLSVNFLHGEFGREIAGLPIEVDAVYGRFVIHAMPEESEARVLLESWRLLRNGGRLFLEFRTIRDPLMNEGAPIGESERVTDHYRRFIDFEELCAKLLAIGFSLDFTIEKQGLAAHGNDDPVVGRVVATKRIY